MCNGYTLEHMTDSQKHVLHVVNRIELGKKASKLRKSDQTPANIFGEEQPSQAVSIRRGDINRFLAGEGEAGLVYLSLEGTNKEIPVLIEEIQYDAVTQAPLHLSFKRVNLNEKVQSEVAVEVVGEAEVAGANIILVKDVLEVEALPADLPESIQVDISNLTEIGQSLTLADALYDRAKVKVLVSEEDLEAPLVIVQEVKEEVEEAPAEAEAAEGEAAPATEEAPADAKAE